MRLPARARTRQHGAALMLFLTVLIVGVAWFTVGALGKAPVAAAEREVLTARSLQQAKQALLGYVAQYAGRFDTAEPGRLPCPESTTLATPGEAAGACSASALVLGRLPWKTLGIDQLRDGAGEPLWYMMRGFRDAPINFGTAGQLAYNGSAVVAMIIAPGRPLETLAEPGTPPAGCSKLSQGAATRNVAPLVAANFLECGTTSGSIASPGSAPWTNDRVIAITAEEWADAIAPSVNDRMQRQVAFVLRTWDDIELAATGKSWGDTHGLPYLPYASTWGNPASTDYCGNQDETRGLLPIDPSCYDNAWSVVNVNTGGLLSIWGAGNGCTDLGAYLRCRFVRVLGLGSATAQITLSASNVARAFRSTLRQQDLTLSNGGSASLSMSLSNSTSDATMTLNLTWPANLLLLSLGQVVSVDIPHLQQAQVLSDSRLTWFRDNEWHRYTYYGVSSGAVVDPNWWELCNGAGDPGCLTVNGLPASSGSTNDKRLVLVLSGKPLAGHVQHSWNLTDYFENQNASVGVVYEAGTVDTAFNDRVATCPFNHADHSGATVSICN